MVEYVSFDKSSIYINYLELLEQGALSRLSLPCEQKGVRTDRMECGGRVNGAPNKLPAGTKVINGYEGCWFNGKNAPSSSSLSSLLER